MAHVETRRVVKAPPADVFAAVAHIEEYEKIQPAITKVEFVSESRSGVGTKFRETRRMRGKEVTTTLEVTEYDAPHRIRILSDEGGTVWDTLFTVTPADGGKSSVLHMRMDARPYKLLAKVAVPLIMRMVSKAVEADMDVVQRHFE